MPQRWTIIEWDLFHPLREALDQLPCVPMRLSMDGVRTPRTLLTLPQLGAALHTALAGTQTMLANPSRGNAKFLWLVVDAEIDLEERVAAHDQCASLAHDPLLMQAVTDAVQAPLRKACEQIALALRAWDQAVMNTSLRPGQDAMQLADTAILLKRMKHELEQAVQQGLRTMHNVQADAPAAPTTGQEIRHHGKIILYLGLGVTGMLLAIGSLVMPPLGVAGLVLGAIGLYRGTLDTVKAFVNNLESAAHVRKRLVKALQGYQGGLKQHGVKTFLTTLANLTLKTNTVYTVAGWGSLASVADLLDEVKEYEGLVQRMRAQLTGLSEALAQKMDSLQQLEREGRLHGKEVDYARFKPSGEQLAPVRLTLSKQELALDALINRIEQQYVGWNRELPELAKLRESLQPLLAEGAKAVAMTEKTLESCINAALTVLGATLDAPNQAHEWTELVVDVTGQVEPAVGLVAQAVARPADPARVPDRFKA